MRLRLLFILSLSLLSGISNQAKGFASISTPVSSHSLMGQTKISSEPSAEESRGRTHTPSSLGVHSPDVACFTLIIGFTQAVVWGFRSLLPFLFIGFNIYIIWYVLLRKKTWARETTAV